MNHLIMIEPRGVTLEGLSALLGSNSLMSLSLLVKNLGKCLVRHMNKESWVMRSQAVIKKLSLPACMAHNSGCRVHIFPMSISLL
jgi:hypothetical protein